MSSLIVSWDRYPKDVLEIFNEAHSVSLLTSSLTADEKKPIERSVFCGKEPIWQKTREAILKAPITCLHSG
jgi:hypothetical protein